MRVLILADAQFAKHERALIERVMVGLAVEGISARLVLPKDRDLGGYSVGLLGEPVHYADRGLLLTQKIRAAQIARQVTQNAENMHGHIDIVHVFGGGAWGMGRELARILGAGVAFEVWRSGLADSIRGLHLGDEDRAMFLVPERAFEANLRRVDPSATIRYVPWGAQVPEEPVPVFRSGKMISIVLMSTGRQTEQSHAAFDGIADAISGREDVMLFANLELVKRADLWSRLKEHNMMGRFTVIDRSEDRRDLLLRCDMMVYPDTLHEERTLLLDTMGAGMVVITGNDDSIQSLRDESGVIVVERPTREEWGVKVRDIIASPEKARACAESVRAYIRKSRRSGLHIESLRDAYQDLVEMESPVKPG
jgi:glycosyltransferase involved in cell wall biosynthesis